MTDGGMPDMPEPEPPPPPPTPAEPFTYFDADREKRKRSGMTTRSSLVIPKSGSDVGTSSY